MALHVPKAPGLAQMLKDGSRHFSGLEEAVYRNISACKEFSDSVKTAYGPRGMNKMIINHISKLFVTNDAATIIKELEVEHPAAKIMIMASQMQEQEVGDGTNFVIILAGSLLSLAEDLLRMGLTPTEVADGYETACRKALELLPSMVCSTVKDYRNKTQVLDPIRSAIMSKQFGNEDFLANLVTDACVSILKEQTTFNVDNVRVCKILGGGILKSEVIPGMVFKHEVQGDVNQATAAKVAVFTCPFDILTSETKGTVLIKTAEELKQFSHNEENLLENSIKSIVDTGVKVVVAGGKFGDMALHFLNKYGIMAVRLSSKWDLRRLCRTVGATALPRLVTPTAEELGYCDNVLTDEVGDTGVVVFRQGGSEHRVSTIVIRGSTHNLMDDIERAIDDGINTFKALTKCGDLVAGGGAMEVELSRQIGSYATTCPGLDQYAIQKFADALQTFPKLLADSTGVNSSQVLSQLFATHQEGKNTAGFVIQGSECGGVMDAVEMKVLDNYLVKYWGIKYATMSAATVLRVDQIIMAKKAGGPKPPAAGSMDPDDD